MNIDKINDLNQVYEPLYRLAKVLIEELKNLDYTTTWGYYGFHSVKHNGDFITEYFPIPVITVDNICDIGLNLDHIFIEGKLIREDGLSFDYSKLESYNFEVYGIEEYTLDFYDKNDGVSSINQNINNSTEDEIGISILIDNIDMISSVIDIVKNFTKWNTYIK